jgi:hypothetical protein
VGFGCPEEVPEKLLFTLDSLFMARRARRGGFAEKSFFFIDLIA